MTRITRLASGGDGAEPLALVMTNRQDLDALIDGRELGYADASTPLEQVRSVAAAALTCAYLLSDSLDVLEAEVAELRKQVDVLTKMVDSGQRPS